jgi:hypothetical protein
VACGSIGSSREKQVVNRQRLSPTPRESGFAASDLAHAVAVPHWSASPCVRSTRRVALDHRTWQSRLSAGGERPITLLGSTLSFISGVARCHFFLRLHTLLAIVGVSRRLLARSNAHVFELQAARIRRVGLM